METDGSDPALLVDLERYPLLHPGSEAHRSCVDDARRQLRDKGAAEIPGFVSPTGVAELVRDADALAPRAHASGGQGTAYLEFPDFCLPADHPRLHFADYRVRAVAYDITPHRLTAAPPLRVGPAQGPDRGRPRPGADLPLRRSVRRAQPRRHGRGRPAAVALRPDGLRRVARHPVGRERAATSRSRRGSAARTTSTTTRWRRCWPATGRGSRRCPMTPGTLLVFEGRHSLHRVSPDRRAPVAPCRPAGLRHEVGHHGQRPLARGPLRAHRGPSRCRPRRLARPGVSTEFGESFVGEGAEAAHVNTVLGAAGGPVETAWVTALATPRAGHAAFVATVTPGIAVRPFTLFVNKAAIEGERHATLTWGAAHAGVASGVMEAVAEGIVPEGEAAGVAPHRGGVGEPPRRPTSVSSSRTTRRRRSALYGPGGRGARGSPRRWRPAHAPTTRTTGPEHYGGPVSPIRLDQVNLVVRDVEASRAFYSRLGLDFGDERDPVWADAPRLGGARRHARRIDVDLDSTSFATKWDQGWPGGTGAVLGFKVDTRDEVDALVAAAVADGRPGPAGALRRVLGRPLRRGERP